MVNEQQICQPRSGSCPDEHALQEVWVANYSAFSRPVEAAKTINNLVINYGLISVTTDKRISTTDMSQVLVKVKKKVKHARSHDGCSECRKRRIGCDKKKPECSRCVEKGVNCEYLIELKFKEDLESKGAVFGREGVWNKNKSLAATTNDLTLSAKDSYFIKPYNYSGIYHFINTTYGDVLQIKPNIFTSIFPTDLYVDTSESQQSISYALAYYLEYVAPIFNPTNIQSLQRNHRLTILGGLNFHDLVQYSQSNTHILYLLLSVGSSYLIKTTSEGRSYWTRQAKHYKDMAMSIYNEKFKLLETQKDNELTLDLLLSTMLLCLFDLADDCNDGWSGHMRSCKWLLKNFAGVSLTDFQLKAATFISDFFGYQEAMGRTACRKLSYFSTEDWESHENSNVMVTWMGCKKGLISVISDITDLSTERLNGDSLMSNGSYLMLSDAIERKLELLKTEDIEEQYAEFKTLNQFVDLENETRREESCFLLGCETKRLATSLYHRCALLNKTPKDPLITDMVHRLAEYLKFIICDNGFFWTFLLWPIYILSVEINPLDPKSEELRSLVLDMLSYLEINTLGNVNKTRDIIMSVWKKRDLNQDEKSTRLNRSSKEKVMGGLNDWDVFVADKELNISLA